jgi:hypothetical protein
MNNILPDPHSFIDCKHLGIAVTHRSILGEAALCALHTMFPSGLPRGPIVLEGFVGNLFIYEPGSAQEEERSQRYQPKVT